MNILVWHVHGGYLTSFVQGSHHYLLPVSADGGGRGSYDFPDSAEDVPEGDLRDREIDVVVLQRVEEIDAVARLTGRVPGRDVAAVFLEHNTPKDGAVPASVHPLADRTDIPVVHVTYFNQLFWDAGRSSTRVVEHGIVDPGPLYRGDVAALAVVINEPVRRWRVTGTDLLPAFAAVAPVDVFGMGGAALAEHPGMPPEVVHRGDLRPHALHHALAARRAYLHPVRWTSLGLALLEAMHLGMPVLALETTEAGRAVPPEAGAISNDVDELRAAARLLLDDPDEARRRGAVAREFALQRYGLDRFLRRWDEVLDDAVADFDRRRRRPVTTSSGGSAGS